MDKIAVLIPCYNEQATIEQVVRDFREYLPEAVVYVYDNNSSDNTYELAKKAGAVVRKEYHQGKGNVIRRMFREIDADCYLMVDGDDTYAAKDGIVMVKEVLEHKVDMVVGDRLSTTYFTENKRLFHNSGNKIVKTAINKLFHSDIEDVMTGYRAMSYQFVKTFPVISKGFEVETEMTIHALDKNMLVKNVLIEYKDRPEGSASKLNTVRDGIKVLGTIGRLYKNYKPLRLFSAVFAVLFVVAVVMFIPVFVEYLQTGVVPRFPTLIMSGVIGMAALMSLFTGFILSVIAEQNRHVFEYNLEQTDFQYKMLKERGSHE